jgi:hypothetical protein
MEKEMKKDCDLNAAIIERSNGKTINNRQEFEAYLEEYKRSGIKRVKEFIDSLDENCNVDIQLTSGEELIGVAFLNSNDFKEFLEKFRELEGSIL